MSYVESQLKMVYFITCCWPIVLVQIAGLLRSPIKTKQTKNLNLSSNKLYILCKTQLFKNLIKQFACFEYEVKRDFKYV